MARTLLRVPASAAPGEVVEIRTLIQHPMETGFRPGENGALHPRDIIRRFICLYNNRPVFDAELHPAIAANPFITFFTTATESGKFEFEWIGDNGYSSTASASIIVE